MSNILTNFVFAFLLVFYSFCIAFASDSNINTSETDEEKPFDWSKPVVSRGFGDIEASTEQDKASVEQYKSGQVLYFFGDYKKAIEKWQPLLKENFAAAQASMGWLYQMGLGIKKDPAQAFQLYSLAANQGNAVAQNNLGVMYEQGISVEVDLVQARTWYRKSAMNGYRYGQFNFANSLYEGFGGAKDVNQAIQWYQKAADQSVEQAKNKLSQIHSEP